MKKSIEKNSFLPFSLSLIGLIFVPILFSLALRISSDFTARYGIGVYFLVPFIPLAIIILALILNKRNKKLHKITIAVSVLGLIIATLVLLFIAGSAILWSAG